VFTPNSRKEEILINHTKRKEEVLPSGKKESKKEEGNSYFLARKKEKRCTAKGGILPASTKPQKTKCGVFFSKIGGGDTSNFVKKERGNQFGAHGRDPFRGGRKRKERRERDSLCSLRRKEKGKRGRPRGRVGRRDLHIPDSDGEGEEKTKSSWPLREREKGGGIVPQY